MAGRAMDTTTSCARCGAQALYMQRTGTLRVQCTYCGFQKPCDRPKYAEQTNETRREFDLRARRNDLELQLTHIPRWVQKMESQHPCLMTPAHRICEEIDDIDARLRLISVT
ncbi:MAG: hypothetical protein NVS2B16_22000 [Chloroflexota bacterium]